MFFTVYLSAYVIVNVVVVFISKFTDRFMSITYQSNK